MTFAHSGSAEEYVVLESKVKSLDSPPGNLNTRRAWLEVGMEMGLRLAKSVGEVSRGSKIVKFTSEGAARSIKIGTLLCATVLPHTFQSTLTSSRHCGVAPGTSVKRQRLSSVLTLFAVPPVEMGGVMVNPSSEATDTESSSKAGVEAGATSSAWPSDHCTRAYSNP